MNKGRYLVVKGGDVSFFTGIGGTVAGYDFCAEIAVK